MVSRSFVHIWPLVFSFLVLQAITISHHLEETMTTLHFQSLWCSCSRVRSVSNKDAIRLWHVWWWFHGQASVTILKWKALKKPSAHCACAVSIIYGLGARLCSYSWSPASSSRRVWHGLPTLVDCMRESIHALCSNFLCLQDIYAE